MASQLLARSCPSFAQWSLSIKDKVSRWKRSILPSLERDFRPTKSLLFLLPDIIPKHSQVFKAALSIHADDLRQRGIHLESRGGKIDLLRGNLLPMTREDINSLYRYLSSYYFPFLLIVPENIQWICHRSLNHRFDDRGTIRIYIFMQQGNFIRFRKLWIINVIFLFSPILIFPRAYFRSSPIDRMLFQRKIINCRDCRPR